MYLTQDMEYELSNAEEFLKLYKGCTTIGSKVLRNYISSTIINPRYDGSYLKFLNEKKHEIFHECRDYCDCCFCHYKGDARFTKKNIDKWIFRELYEEIKGRKVVCLNYQSYLQFSDGNNNKFKSNISCICRFIPKGESSIKNLDVTMSCALIVMEGRSNEDVLSIRDIRNILSHHPCPDLVLDYKSIWEKLSSSVLSLANVIGEFYREAVDDHLADIKSQRLNTEEQTRLKQYVQAELQEVKTSLASNKTQMECMAKTLELLVHRDKVRADCKFCNISNLDDQGKIKMTAKIDQIPPNWNSTKINENLNHLAEYAHSKDDGFQICSSEKKCILLHLEASADVFGNRDTLEAALQKLLDRIIVAGDIDTSVSATINLKIERKRDEIYINDGESSSNVVDDTSDVHLSCSSPQFSLVEIGFLTSVVLDIFPKILREWILNFTKDDFLEFRKYLSPSVLELKSLNDLDLEQLFEYIMMSSLNDETKPLKDINRMVSLKKKIFHRSSTLVNDEEMSLHCADIIEIVTLFDELLLKVGEDSFIQETHNLLTYWYNACNKDNVVEDDVEGKGDESDIVYSHEKRPGNDLAQMSTRLSTLTENKRRHYVKTKTKTIDSRTFSTATSSDSGLGSEKIMTSHIKRQRQRKLIAITDTLSKMIFFKQDPHTSLSEQFKCYEEAAVIQRELPRATETEETLDQHIADEDCVTHF